jgi:hypothetical protein
MSAVYAGLFGHRRPKSYAQRDLLSRSRNDRSGSAGRNGSDFRRSLGRHRCGIDLHGLVALRRYFLVRISGSFFNIRMIDGLSCAC